MDDVLDELRKRVSDAHQYFGETRENQKEDQKFFAGSPDNNYQWPEDAADIRALKLRNGKIYKRPMLTVNRLPQHVRQITNDMRQNRPSAKAVAVDSNADPKVASILSDLLRQTFRSSNFNSIMDAAFEPAVVHGEGYWRLVTDYCDDTTFDQDVKIVPIADPFSVLMDPSSREFCGEDAEWCVVFDTMSKEEFSVKYPNADMSFDNMSPTEMSIWCLNERVSIAEYFYYEWEKKTLNLYPGGSTAIEGTKEDEELKKNYKSGPVKSRKVDKKKVKWIKTNGLSILETKDWIDDFIPVVRVQGNRFLIEGKLEFSGIVRCAKDAQRMYNYQVTNEAEHIAMSPKAPYVAYAESIKGYETIWDSANLMPHSVLPVNETAMDGQGRPLPLPQRSQPPMIPSGIVAAKQAAADDIKATTGQYNASLGMQGNERSGRAIMARQREGDVGSYHYIDNLSKAVCYTAKQLISIYPKLYDTKRVVRIIGEDDKASFVRIDTDQTSAVTPVKKDDEILYEIYNPSVGKYDVAIEAGPDYTTKREEARVAMADIFATNHDLWNKIGHEFVKVMDWPGADRMADILKRAVDPYLLGEGENPQIKQMQSQIEQLTGLLDKVEESLKVQDLKIKAYDAETKRISATQIGMTPEQVSDIAQGTVDAALTPGDLQIG